MRFFVLALLLGSAALSASAAPAEAPIDTTEAVQTETGLVSRLSSQLQLARDNVSERASQLVGNAMGFLGVPYKYGGNSVESGGFDCSGFVRAVYEKSLGKVLPRRASDQAAATQSIERAELKPGDLVFFNTMKRAFSHVGIYVGEGKFIHAPSSGSTVRVEDMRNSYWQKRFNGARRVLPAETTPTLLLPAAHATPAPPEQ